MVQDFITINLPSQGLCYPHKKGQLKLAYMTTKDEDILSDAKLREQHKAINTLLSRLIQDDDFVVDELCVEDRDYIISQIIKYNYGNSHINPKDGTNIDLNLIEYSSFTCPINEKGLCEYQAEGLPLIQFRIIKHKDELEGFQMLEGINDENFLTQIAETEKMLLKTITMQIGDKEDASYVEKFIDELVNEDRVNYIHYISNNTPHCNIDVDFDTLLLSMVTNLMK